MKNNLLNCRKLLKQPGLQRKDEINLNVRVAKAEKTRLMAHGQNLNARKMDDRQPSPEQGKVQRLSRKGVGTSVPKW